MSSRRCSTCGRDFMPRQGHPGDAFCWRCRPGRRKRKATRAARDRAFGEIRSATEGER